MNLSEHELEALKKTIKKRNDYKENNNERNNQN